MIFICSGAVESKWIKKACIVHGAEFILSLASALRDKRFTDSFVNWEN